MSWLFSQALAEEYSAGTSLDGGQFAQLNVMPTPHKFWRNDKTIESSDHSRFGLTSQVLTEDRGEELLTSYLAAFHAKTLVSLEKVREFGVSEVDYGTTRNALFAKWDQVSHTWKTAQHSLFEDLESSLETWPRSGLMLNGECFHVPTLAEFICEKESGLKVPTTGANEGKGASKNRYLNSPNFRGAKMSEGLRTCEDDPIYLNPLFAELTMMWPLGWTDLKPLGMDKFREWQQQHGGF